MCIVYLSIEKFAFSQSKRIWYTFCIPLQSDTDVALFGAFVFGGNKVQVTLPATASGWYDRTQSTHVTPSPSVPGAHTAD